MYDAAPEIASFMCPSSQCGLSPAELRVPGAVDVARAILNFGDSLDLEVKIMSRPVEERIVDDGASAADAPLEPLPRPVYHVTLVDARGRRSRDVVENLSSLPRLKDMKLRRDLLLKKFPCYVHSVGDATDASDDDDVVSVNYADTQTNSGKRDAAHITLTSTASSPPLIVDFVAVPIEENDKLRQFNEELIAFYTRVRKEDYFFPRNGQVVVGRDRDEVVMRYQLAQDVAFGDSQAQVKQTPVYAVQWFFVLSVSLSGIVQYFVSVPVGHFIRVLDNVVSHFFCLWYA